MACVSPKNGAKTMRIDKYYSVISNSTGMVMSEHMTRRDAISNCDRKSEHVVACACEVFNDSNAGHTFMADTMTEAVRNLKAEK